MFRQNLKTRPLWVRSLLAWGITSAIYPVEPALHLPYLRGEFLIINGKRDELIPAESARRLQELTPEPKTVVNLDVYNLFNANTVLTVNYAYATWERPTSILLARFAKIGVQFDF